MCRPAPARHAFLQVEHNPAALWPLRGSASDEPTRCPKDGVLASLHSSSHCRTAYTRVRAKAEGLPRVCAPGDAPRATRSVGRRGVVPPSKETRSSMDTQVPRRYTEGCAPPFSKPGETVEGHKSRSRSRVICSGVWPDQPTRHLHYRLSRRKGRHRTRRHRTRLYATSTSPRHTDSLPCQVIHTLSNATTTSRQTSGGNEEDGTQHVNRYPQLDG